MKPSEPTPSQTELENRMEDIIYGVVIGTAVGAGVGIDPNDAIAQLEALLAESYKKGFIDGALRNEI